MTSPNTDAPPQATSAQKPTRALPTPRMSFPKQLEVLRAFAVAAGQTNKPVNNTELANLTKLNVSSASYNNVFFAESGFITKIGNGYVPATEVASFARTWAFDPAKAAHKLAPLMRRTWYGDVVLRELAMRPRPENDLISELGDLAAATTDYRPQLRLLLDYLEAAGLVERDGSTVREGPTARGQDSSRSEDNGTAPEAPLQTQAPPTRREPTGPVATSFSQSPEGAIQFSVNVNVDLRELAQWRPEVVAAFFNGVAQVISAKAMVERDVSK